MAFFVSVALLCGCRPAATTVSGRVTIDGEPLVAAAMMFYPVAGDGRTSHAFTDKEGRYAATIDPTKMAVTISLFKPKGDSQNGEPILEESIPGRYSERSRSELLMSPVEGRNTECNFDLSTSATASTR
jgi:hypothetical protein